MTTHYTTTAKALHWSIAVLILGLLGLGFYMTGLPLSPRKLQLYSWHKWAGVSVFLLAVVRLAWRATHRPPALPQHMGPLERLAAHAGHHLLYVLMFAIPLAGWLYETRGAALLFAASALWMVPLGVLFVALLRRHQGRPQP